MNSAGKRMLSGSQMQGVEGRRLQLFASVWRAVRPKIQLFPVTKSDKSLALAKQPLIAIFLPTSNVEVLRSMATGYSDLEVYYGEPSTAPIAVQEEKIVTHVTTYSDNLKSSDLSPSKPPSRPAICSLCGVQFTRTRLALLILVLLVVAGGIAGGVVAGVVVNRNSQSRASAPAGDAASSSSTGVSPGSSSVPSSSSSVSSSSTSVPSSSSSESSSASSTTATSTTQKPGTLVTSTEVVSPTQTLYRDCPSSNNTVYNAFGSEAYQFRKICGRSFKQPPSNVVNQAVGSLNDCIDLCAAYNVSNKTEIAAGKSSPCNSVCWRNSAKDPDFPGQCFGSTIFNSSVGFQTRDEVICDSGAWINQNL